MLVVLRHPKNEHYAAAFEKGVEKQTKGLDELEKFLARGGTPYIAGDQLSIADIHIFSEATTEFFVNNPTTPDNAEKRPLTQAWRDRVVAHPGIKDVHAEFLAKGLPLARGLSKAEKFGAKHALLLAKGAFGK